MRTKILLTGIIFFSLTLISNGQGAVLKEKRVKLNAEIDSILQSQVDLDKIPGAVILIKKDTQVIYQHAYGYAQKYDYDHNLLNPPEKMTVDHLFDIASLTSLEPQHRLCYL